MQFIAKTIDSFTELKIATASVLRDAWSYQRGQFVLVLLLSVGVGLVPYAVSGSQALLLNELVRIVATKSAGGTLFFFVAVLGGAFLLRSGASSAYQYYRKLTWMDRRQKYDFQLTEKLASLDVATHEDPAFQDELTIVREQGASFAVTNFLEALVSNLQNVAGLVAASVVVCAVDWRYFVLIATVSLPQLYSELRYGSGLWSIHQSQSRDRRLYAEMGRHTSNVRGIRELHTFQSSGYFLGRLKEILTRFLESEKAEERKRYWFRLVAECLSVTGIIAVILMLALRIVEGNLQIGTFMFVLAAIFGLEGTLSSFLISVADQRTEARLVAAYFAIMRRQPRIQSASHALPLVVTRAPQIEFRNVSFAYPGNPTELILKNLSLTIGSGERVALVGINGAGKSTLIKLLCRFYDPTEGSICIDGVDLKDIDLSSWYRHVALLSQDYEQYHLQAWENIALGRHSTEAGPVSVKPVAERARAHRFIEAWREGYKQQLGQEFSGGIDPSGGQWQKLALARTLFRDGFITILDEPTAHVDAEAEAEIFELLLSQLSSDQTLLLISHRFSTVRKADRICVLRDGTVAELGSHIELVSKGGIYAGLFAKQAEGYQ